MTLAYEDPVNRRVNCEGRGPKSVAIPAARFARLMISRKDYYDYRTSLAVIQTTLLS